MRTQGNLWFFDQHGWISYGTVSTARQVDAWVAAQTGKYDQHWSCILFFGMYRGKRGPHVFDANGTYCGMLR